MKPIRFYLMPAPSILCNIAKTRVTEQVFCKTSFSADLYAKIRDIYLQQKEGFPLTDRQ